MSYFSAEVDTYPFNATAIGNNGSCRRQPAGDSQTYERSRIQGNFARIFRLAVVNLQLRKTSLRTDHLKVSFISSYA